MNQQLSALREPSQLFHHISRYRVVICTLCRHAVPPRAIDRHLKEIHGMTHSRRSSFVNFVQGLDLCEPQDVTPPGQNEFPIPELPVLNGLRCSFGTCSYLCLTEKRMKSHWSLAKHSCVMQKQSWFSVPVQTFFRGNLLKYFSGLVQPPETELAKCSTAELSTCFLTGAYNIDERLLQHYCTLTSTMITSDSSDTTFWQQTVPQLAHEHDFLMSAILALTSLHLAHLNTDRQREFAIHASSYQDRAMPIFRKVVAAPTSENCNAIVVFHHLLVLYSFAAEQQDDDDLFLISRDDNEVAPRWLHFIRSACVILQDVRHWVEVGPCQTLLLSWEAPLKINKIVKKSIMETLLTLIPPKSSPRFWRQNIVNIYNEASSQLALAFACSTDQFTIWDALRLWPVTISVDFMNLLREEHPCALVLVAHYTVLLQRIDNEWYFRGRANRLLKTIHRKLDPYWYPYIPPVLALDGA